jgi:hypothetical protein
MSDPDRLRLKAGSAEARLLGAARSVEPPADAEQEVWRRLHAASAVGVAAGAAALLAERSAAGGSSLIAKLGTAAGLKWLAVVAVAAPVAGIAVQQSVVRARRAAATHVEAPRVTAPAVEAQPASAMPAAGAGAGAPPAEAPVVAITTTTDDSRLRPVRAAPTPSNTPVAAVGAKSDPRASLTSLTKEGRLLGVARSKLASGDARGALAEVAHLDALFPSGALVQEREIVAIDALGALGDTEGARARADAFLRSFPASPYAAHLRQTVAR